MSLLRVRVRDRVGRARFQASSIARWFDRPTSWTIASYALLFFALLFVRRSAQLRHPQVWDEEGLRILPDLIDHGAASILAPLNGYLVVISRLVGFIAFSMSFAGYPLITTVCDWAFTIAVLIAIAISPTVLRGGVLLALAALLVPSDPEVFGVPLYEFWWAGLLIVVAAFWRPGARGTVWRCAFVALGGLSSPIIVLVLPLFLGRLMAWWKDPAERIVTGIAVLCCAIQIDALWRSHTVPQASILRASGLVVTLQKFIGDYVVGSFGRFGIADTNAWQWIAVALSITIIVAAFAVSRRNVVVFAALAYLIVGSIALSIARVDVFIIDPSGNAPRYFFYPFIFEGWLFLQIALLADNRLVKIAATALLGLVLIDAVPTLSRSAADLRWSENVAQCDAAGDDQRYLIPFEFVGTARPTFELALTGRQCRALARRDLFLKAGILPTQRPPYRRYDFNARDPSLAINVPTAAQSIVANGWNGTDFGHTRLAGYTIIGSYRVADADTGRLMLRLHRGDRVLFRTGPVAAHQYLVLSGPVSATFTTLLPQAPDWVVLAFIDPRLPATFDAAFEDEGNQWGEWSAIALRAGAVQRAR